MGVLQNFIKLFNIDPSARFIFVTNASIAPGNMDVFYKGSLSDDHYRHRESKLGTHGEKLETSFDKFKTQISFEQHSQANLEREISKILIEKFGVNVGSETPFLQSLLAIVTYAPRKCILTAYQRV